MAKNQMDPKDILKRPYEFVIIPEDEGGFSARVAEFPGCLAEGETGEEALANLLIVAENWILDALDSGMEIPVPVESYSGRVALRLPSELHRAASREAARQGTSLNQFLVSATAYAVGYSTAREEAARSLRSAVEEAAGHLLLSLPVSSTGVERRWDVTKIFDRDRTAEGRLLTVSTHLVAEPKTVPRREMPDANVRREVADTKVSYVH